MTLLKFEITDNYQYLLPDALVDALKASIAQHFRAYGLHNVQIVSITKEETQK